MKKASNPNPLEGAARLNPTPALPLVIEDASEYVSIVEDSYLNVCICDKGCDYAAPLRDMIENGYYMLIHVKNPDGEIVPLTADMLANA